MRDQGTGTKGATGDPESGQTEWRPPARIRPEESGLPKPRVDLTALFGLAAGKWAWSTALKATVAMASSFALASWLFGSQAGALAALGSMAVLYERTTPYAHRAVALAIVGLGFVLSVAIGSFASTTLWTGALAIGLVAGIATWLCQALRVDRPGAMFFVLVCAISTITPGGVADVPAHAAVAAVGAAVGWLVSMSGAVLQGRRPEHRAVAGAFNQLSALLNAIGTPRLDHVQHDASLAVADAWRLVLLAQTRGYRDTAAAARLRALLRWVSDIHLAATDVSLARTEPLPKEAVEFAASLAEAVYKPQACPDPDILDPLLKGLRPRSLESRLYTRLVRAAQTARRTEHDMEGRGLELYDSRYPSLGDSLRSSLGRDSLILPTALRMAITVAAAGLVGISLGIDRYYWISITTASVLQAGNVVLTVNRGTQRALGTLVGVFIGVGLLLLDLPLPATIALAAGFQGLTQLVIARNFFYGSILLTPMALMVAHTAAPYPVDLLAESRVLDTVLGSIIGMLGAVLLWRKTSAARLPQTIEDVLHEARTVVNTALDPDERISPQQRYRLRRDLRAALLSLRSVYDSAIGDVPRADTTQPLWPVVVATQRIGYLALSVLAREQPPPASHITLQRLDLAFRELTAAMWERRAPRLGALPRLVDYPRINRELRALASAIRVAAAEDERAARRAQEQRSDDEAAKARSEGAGEL